MMASVIHKVLRRLLLQLVDAPPGNLVEHGAKLRPQGLRNLEQLIAWKAQHGHQTAYSKRPICLVRYDMTKRHTNGSGSKNRYRNGTLVSGNMDQNPRNPYRLILSHSQIASSSHEVRCVAERCENKWSKLSKCLQHIF